MAREIKIPKWEQYKDSVYSYVIDLTLINQELGVTSSAATWSTDDTSIVSLGTSVFSAPNTSTPITALSPGSALVKVAMTTSGDDAPIYFFEVKVIDPEAC